jgi:alpha-glucosidase (family GH31 glycosyl hydrolase)
MFQFAVRKGLSMSMVLFCCVALSANAKNDPKANQNSTVHFGHARFTLLSPQLVRMEYSDTGEFEDKASLTFINRNLPIPAFTQNITANTMRITTQYLDITYVDDGKKFDEHNLHVDIKTLKKKVTSWLPNQIDKNNLKGTLRTLDQANGWNFEKNVEQGLLSRDGWVLIDDSNNLLFDANPDWNWVTARVQKNISRTQNNIDWYLLGYGTDYKKALYDYTQVAGKIPMPPKYAFGYWWSRYWIYNDSEVRERVQQFRDFSIPQDVLILDMDWHETYGFQGNNIELKPAELDPEGQLKGWTGYTWNKHLFPQPEKFIQWTNTQHLKTALNLHPASGIPTMEEKHAEFAKKYGSNANTYIPFTISEKKWASTYFETILKPMEQWGIDFWWLDWQQYTHDKIIPNLNVTGWLNYTFFSHMEKSNNRPMIFHRWGGLGNHRYPIGFSGDAHTNWETLDFETYFTATAANVGYGYWSHDIGGHISNGQTTDGELYLRWIQFGVFSPILRTHASKISLIERRPWMFPQHFIAMRDAIKLRYRLAPYIYTAARHAYDTGVSIVHPLYYNFPHDDEAYRFKTQYMFGNDMLVAPITTPVNKNTQLAQKKIWLPKGEWFDFSSGTLLQGNTVITSHYALDEIPLLIKAGSIIPMTNDVNNLQEKTNTTILTIIPGGNIDNNTNNTDNNTKNTSSTELYNDDETSSAYQRGEFTRRNVTKNWLDNKTLQIHIDATVGSYPQMPLSHFFMIDLLNCMLPKKVMVNGKPLLPEFFSAFSYTNLLSRIRLPETSVHSAIDIEIHFELSHAEQNRLFNGNKGFLQRIHQATEKLKYEAALTDWGGTLPNEIYDLGNVRNELIYNPEQAPVLLKKLNASKKQVKQTLLNIPNIPKEKIEPLIEYLEY